MHISRPSMQNTFQLPRFIFGPLKEDILVSHKVVLTTNQSVHCTLLENHKKVSFNTASEASYVYILSGRKFIKNAKNGTKIVETAKIENSNATFWCFSCKVSDQVCICPRWKGFGLWMLRFRTMLGTGKVSLMMGILTHTLVSSPVHLRKWCDCASSWLEENARHFR